MKYRAICFDVDGTLYPVQLMKELGAKCVRKHPLFSLRYRKMRGIFRSVQEDFASLGLEHASMEEKEATCLCRTYRRKISVEKAAELLRRKEYKPLEEVYRKLPCQKSVVRTFENLKRKGLIIGVYSDWPLFDKLERIGIKSYVDYAESSMNLGFLKPSPECFRRLVADIGVDTSEILYVGDSYYKDVEGANACGIDAVLVNCTDSDNKRYNKALHVCRDWTEFDEWISSLMEEK